MRNELELAKGYRQVTSRQHMQNHKERKPGQSGMLIAGTSKRRNRRDASREGDKGEIIRSFLG